MAKLLVIGPGAIGAWCAATIGGTHDVHLGVRSESQQQTLQAQGVIADGSRGKHRLLEVLIPEDAPRASYDAVLLATKCADAAPALQSWAAHILDAPVVSLQNGLMHSSLAPHVRGTLHDAVVCFPATLLGTGHTQRTGPGGFIIGAEAPSALDVLAEAGPLARSTNLVGAKWTKLVINSCITGLGAISGTGLGGLLQSRRVRELFLQLVAQGHAVGRASGIDFAPVQRFRPALFDTNGPMPGAVQHLALRVLGRKYRDHRSSSLQSIERGRASEVPYLNGRISEEGRRHGIATPTHDAVVAIDAAIAAGRAAPSMELLETLEVPRA